MEILLTSLTFEGWITLALFGLILVLLFLEWRPPYITMLLGATFLLIFGIITPWEFIQGFSNTTLLTIAMVCIVVRAVENQGVVSRFTKRILSQSKYYVVRLFSLIFPVSVVSAFFNNTPVVLFLTPIVRLWSLKNDSFPSKFLIPLSYASLMGGLCTLIGTSTNLVVESLMVTVNPAVRFGFFELAKIGLPILCLGYLYLLLFSKKLLPERKDPLLDLAKNIKEYSVEFVVLPECDLVDKPIRGSGYEPFGDALLLAIERKGGGIDAPSSEEMILVNDRLIFTGSIEAIAHLHTIDGLQSQADPLFKLEVTSPHFSEIVIPSTSSFIGKSLKKIHFRHAYGASVFAIYRQGDRLKGDMGNIFLRSGDVLMLLSNEYWDPDHGRDDDYLLLRNNERVPIFDPYRGSFVLCVLLAMVVAAVTGVPIFIASLTAAFVLVLTRSISLTECKNAVPWTLLLLIVAAIAFGSALQVTGVAYTLAKGLLGIVGKDPTYLIGAILLITMITTEIITNNVAVVLVFPLAIEAMQLAGYTSPETVKTVGVAIAVAGSSGYALPTGYQTHLLVYGPGGYRFKDFIKIGLPLDIMVWVVATLLVPLIWGLS